MYPTRDPQTSWCRPHQRARRPSDRKSIKTRPQRPTSFVRVGVWVPKTEFLHKGLDFFATGAKSGIQGKHTDRLRLILGPIERVNQRPGHGLAWFGPARTPRCEKGDVGRQGERELACHVHVCWESM